MRTYPEPCPCRSPPSREHPPPAHRTRERDRRPPRRPSPRHRAPVSTLQVGPRKGRNFFYQLPLRDLALWSWASCLYSEVASPSKAWRGADMAACVAVSSSLPGWHCSSQLYCDEQRHSHDRPSQRWESQLRSTVLIKTILQQKCQHCSAACESPHAYSMTVHGVLC